MLSTILDQLFVLLVRNLGCYWNAHIPMQGYIIFYGTRGTLIWERSWASQQDHSHPLENVWKISVQVVSEVYILEKATLKVLELTRRENFWQPPSSRTVSLAYYLTCYSLPQSHLLGGCISQQVLKLTPCLHRLWHTNCKSKWND